MFSLCNEYICKNNTAAWGLRLSPLTCLNIIHLSDNTFSAKSQNWFSKDDWYHAGLCLGYFSSLNLFPCDLLSARSKTAGVRFKHQRNFGPLTNWALPCNTELPSTWLNLRPISWLHTQTAGGLEASAGKGKCTHPHTNLSMSLFPREINICALSQAASVS